MQKKVLAEEEQAPDSQESEIVFANKKQHELFLEAGFSVDAENFLRNNSVGRYLMGCAEQDIVVLQEEMSHLDPEDDSFLTDYRSKSLKLQAAEFFIVWINEAIERGRNAEFELRESEKEEGM